MFSKLAKGIETFITKQGELTSMLIFPLLGVVVYEVIMRYGFNSPTSWGFEATAFIYSLHFMFGLSYTDVKKEHVEVNIFTSLASSRVRAALGALTTAVFMLPVLFFLTYSSTTFAWSSLQGLEKNPTSWAPPIYPFKIAMAVCFFFLFIQGVANLIRNLQVLFNKNN